MGSIDIIKPLSTVLSRASNKSLQHWIIFGNTENRTRGRWVHSEIHCAMRPPPNFKKLLPVKESLIFNQSINSNMQLVKENGHWNSSTVARSLNSTQQEQRNNVGGKGLSSQWRSWSLEKLGIWTLWKISFVATQHGTKMYNYLVINRERKRRGKKQTD